MSSKSLRAWFVAIVVAVAALQAHAAGLGRLEVKSALGDPFRAEISVLAEKNEVAALSARMASPEAFQRAGLIYGGAVAGMRVSVEKRADGEPYVLITSTDKVNDPVVDLLIELAWSSGRVAREYTAFVDPPFIVAERAKKRAAEAAAAATTKPVEAQPIPQPQPLPETKAPEKAPAAAEPAQPSAEAAPAPAPVPDAPIKAEAPKPAEAKPAKEMPVEMIGGTAPTLLESAPAPMAQPAETYGPVKYGDTLSKIALKTKPADVTLDQMLVLLVRKNPDAFVGKNMNRLKTGKIIEMPDSAAYDSVSAGEARKVVRLQAANWKAYRERVAAAAEEQKPAAAEPAQQAAAGQVKPKVEEPAKPKTEAKEVLKLSEGAPAAGAAAGGTQQGKRALEEELVARDKAIKESNERVARLEKTIKDLQALLEVKNQGMAELQKQAGGQTSATKPQPPAAPAPAQTAPKPQTPAQPAPSTPQAGAPGPDMRAQTPAATPAKEAPPASPAPQATAPAPKPRPQPPAPPPPPPPSLLDQVLGQPYYLAAGVLLILVIALGGARALRRRRETKSESEDTAPARAGAFSGASAGFAPEESDVGLAASRSRDSSEEVDPLEEAEIFLAYGRDAQAEELLKEALTAHPRRYEIHAKLLEIYAKRNDKTGFESVARELQQGTGGSGELWDRAVRLGYQIDPGNPRYAAGKSGDEEAHGESAEQTASPAERLDFDVGLGDEAESTTATDIDLGATSQFERTQIINRADAESPEALQPPALNLDVELPPSAAEPELPETEAKPAGNAIEFDFDVSKLGGAGTESPPSDRTESTGGLDFDIGSSAGEANEDRTDSATPPALDLSGISLDLDGTSTTPTSPGGKDEKWYEVQTKFDLAKAYQEMGDKDGAREILKEVIAEGDAEQQAAAQSVLTSLD